MCTKIFENISKQLNNFKMKNLKSPYYNDFNNVVSLFKTNLELVPYNWLTDNQVKRLEKLATSFSQLVEQTFNIWPEVRFVSEEQLPYQNIKDIQDLIDSDNVIYISDTNNPSYVTEQTNCFIRLGHDLIHLQAVKRWPGAGIEFSTNTELLTYALTTELILNSDWSSEDKQLFLDYHYSDFVVQTLLFESLGGFMDIQTLMIPKYNGIDWRQFINLPNIDLI